MRSRVYTRVCTRVSGVAADTRSPSRAVKTVKTTARTDTSFRDVHERRPPKTGCRHDRHHGKGEGSGVGGEGREVGGELNRNR